LTFAGSPSAGEKIPGEGDLAEEKFSSEGRANPSIRRDPRR